MEVSRVSGAVYQIYGIKKEVPLRVRRHRTPLHPEFPTLDAKACNILGGSGDLV